MTKALNWLHRTIIVLHTNCVQKILTWQLQQANRLIEEFIVEPQQLELRFRLLGHLKHLRQIQKRLSAFGYVNPNDALKEAAAESAFVMRIAEGQRANLNLFYAFSQQSSTEQKKLE